MYNPNDKQNNFVVVPTYNESACIEEVIRGLACLNYSIVVVDDGSADPIKLNIPYKNLYLLRHPINLGQGASLQTGFEFALQNGAAIIITYDADGQHNASDIERLIAILQEENWDIVLGSRFLQDNNQIPSKRKWLLKTARYINYLFTGLLLSDAHNGLRALTAKAARQIKISENRMAHATEILSQIRANRLRYKEVPVTIFYTAYSAEKGQKAWNGFRIIFDLFLNKVFK